MTPNSDFYRIDTALVVPQVSKDSWKLTIDGLVDNPLELTFDDLLARPQIERYVTLSCVSNEVGGDLVGNALWQGVLLKDILEEAGLQPGAEQLASRSADGWTCGTPLDVVMDGRDAMLAVAMNGEPLPAPARLPGAHGRAGPVRLRVGDEMGHRPAPHHLGGLRRVLDPARLVETRAGQDDGPHRHAPQRQPTAPARSPSVAWPGRSTAGSARSQVRDRRRRVARRRTRRRAVQRHVGAMGVPLDRRAGSAPDRGPGDRQGRRDPARGAGRARARTAPRATTASACTSRLPDSGERRRGKRRRPSSAVPRTLGRPRS